MILIITVLILIVVDSWLDWIKDWSIELVREWKRKR